MKRMKRTSVNKKSAKRKNRCPGVLAAVAAAILMIGCGAAKDTSAGSLAAPEASQYNSASVSYSSESMAAGGTSYDGGYAEGDYDFEASMDITDMPKEESGIADRADGNLPQGRKLIKTVDLEMETKEFEGMMSELETQVQDLGGYIENMETYNGSSYSSRRGSRWANLTIRIPSGTLNGFLQNMSAIGNVVRRSDSVEDVTLSYVDMESRRDALKAEQARLLELLGQADTVEDMIALEERLSNVRYCLESMESKLRTIDNQVDYSTVCLNLSEVEELTPVEEKTDLQRVTEGFADSLKDIGSGIKEGAIWFVIHIPYLVIWAAVIAVLALILKRCRKRYTVRKEAPKTKGTRDDAPKTEGTRDGAPRTEETGTAPTKSE